MALVLAFTLTAACGRPGNDGRGDACTPLPSDAGADATDPCGGAPNACVFLSPTYFDDKGNFSDCGSGGGTYCVTRCISNDDCAGYPDKPHCAAYCGKGGRCMPSSP
jgi:hypothetical protein